MYDNNSKGISYSAGFFMLIAFAIAGILLASQLNEYIWTFMTGKDYTKSFSGTPDPADGTAYKIIQSVQAIVGFFLPTLLVAQLLHKRPARLLGFSFNITLKQVGIIVLITVAGIFVSSALTYFSYQIPIPASWKIDFDKLQTEYNQKVEAIIRLKNTGDLIIALVVMGLLPALCEETLFRGGLQNFLYRSTEKAWLAIIVTSLIFGLVHFEFYGFLYRFFLSVILGLVYLYSGKIWLSILIHFLNNAVVMTAYYISVQHGKPMTDATTNPNTYYWGLIGILPLIGLLRLFRKESAGVKLNS